MHLTQHQIIATAEGSLPAEIFKAIPGMIGSVIWDSTKGPAENLLGLIDLGMMVVPSGITQLVFVVSNVLGLNAAALGRYIDKTMGWKTLGDLASSNLEDVVQKLTGFDRVAQRKILESFKSSNMSAFSGTERSAYDGFVSEARGNPSRRRRTPNTYKKQHTVDTPEEQHHYRAPVDRRTPSQKALEEHEQKVLQKKLERNYKDDAPFLENFDNIVMKGTGLLDILSKLTKIKFSPGLVVVAIIGLIKWAMSMTFGLGKFMLENKKTGLAMVVGGAAAASYAYVKWFAGDDASEEDINKGVESGANIFSEKVRTGLNSLFPEKRDFRGTLEYLIDSAMVN